MFESVCVCGAKSHKEEKKKKKAQKKKTHSQKTHTIIFFHYIIPKNCVFFKYKKNFGRKKKKET